MSADEEKAIEWFKYLQETRQEQVRQQAWVGTNTFDAIDTVLNLIKKQQEQIEELKQDYTKDWEDRCNLVYKELNEEIELQDKILRLIISDMQIEGYFKDMKYESVIEYYKRRKDLWEE